MRTSMVVVLGLAALVLACALPVAAAAGPITGPGAAAVYDGVGSWLDIFARSAWSNPRGVVASLEAHGVSTLYLETSNYSQREDMAYFTYYAKTPAAAYTYARVVVAIRQDTGRPDVPIHVIGGIANRVRPGTFASFAQALSDCGVAGASLYAFPETSAAEWSGLARVTLAAAPVPACTG